MGVFLYYVPAAFRRPVGVPSWIVGCRKACAGGLAGRPDALSRRRSHIVIVSNEVGMGLVPETPLGRAFRDLTGFAHQRITAVADEVYLAAMGAVLRLRPAPLEVVAP